MKRTGTQDAEGRADGVAVVWRAWVGMTAFAAVATAVFFAFAGEPGLRRAVQEGPLSIGAQTAASVAVLWFAYGAALAAMQSRRMRFRYGLATVLALVLLALAVNFLRERIHYVDVADYVQAAQELRDGVAFHGRYLHPPMLAMLVQPLLMLGNGAPRGRCGC